jgi:hypothetical protein
MHPKAQEILEEQGNKDTNRGHKAPKPQRQKQQQQPPPPESNDTHTTRGGKQSTLLHHLNKTNTANTVTTAAP